MALSVIMSLVALPIGIVSLELQGNYKFWDSVSDQMVYDYSGQNHHGEMYDSYIFTDRGFTTNSQASFKVETSYYASNIQQAVLSFWIHCPDMTTNVSIASSSDASDARLVVASYNQKAKSISTVPPGTYTLSTFPSLNNDWNLYTAVYNLSDQSWDVKLYINHKLGYSTIIASHPFIINRLSVDLKLSPSRKNIIYELWWHTGLSSISDLGFMISTRGNPTSPTEIDLPAHENKKNSSGQDCSKDCDPPSCNSEKKCLTFPNTACRYGLYEISTSDCLFFCPDDSCICSNPPETGKEKLETLTCGCKAGYKQVRSNPLGCISSACTSHSEIGYRYICTACIAPYILDSTQTSCIIPNCKTLKPDGSSCVTCSEKYLVDSYSQCSQCNTGYKVVSETPFTCDIGITNCISYTLSDNQWICQLCTQGYTVDPYNHCNLCDTGYIIYATSPFICIREIINCISYDAPAVGSCNQCRDGYTLGCGNTCCECDSSRNYIGVSEDPIVCTASISNCIEYLKYDTDWGCGICNIGYALDSLNRCDACAEGYLEFWDEEFKCISVIEGCLDYAYNSSNARYICIECQEGLLLHDGKCEECGLGSYVSKADPVVCIDCPQKCESCRETQGVLKCNSCEYGYVIASDLCECGSREFQIEGSMCNPIPLNVTISSFTNILSLSFNKPLADHLSLSDITMHLPKEIDAAYLVYEIITVQDYEEYVISFSYSMDIDIIIQITLAFLDSVKDRQDQSLSDQTHITQLHIEKSDFFEEIVCDSSCKQCEKKGNDTECTSCYDYAYISNRLCACFIEESEQPGLNCTARCSDGMILNTHSKTCEKIEESSDPETPEDPPKTPDSISASIQAPAGTKGVVAACVSVSLISLNLNNVLSIIGTIEILSYIMLYNLPLPSEIEELLKGLSILEFHPNIFEYFIPHSDTLKDYRYARMDYKSEIFLINSGISVTILFYLLCLYVIAKLLDRCISEYPVLKRAISKVLDSLKWNIIVGYLFSIYLELVVTSLINIRYADFSDTSSIIGFIISIIVAVISMISPIKLLLFYLANEDSIKNNTAGNTYSTLYSNLKTDDIEYCMVNVIVMIRRLLFGVTLVFLYSSPYIQVVVNSSMAAALCYFIALNRPFKEKVDNVMNIFTETVVFIIQSLIGAFIYVDMNEGLYNAVKWIIVVLLYASIIVPALIQLGVLLKDVFKYFSDRTKSEENVPPNVPPKVQPTTEQVFGIT